MPSSVVSGGAGGICKTCHSLPMRFFAGKQGYRHFARSHKLAEERGFSCRKCHGEVELLRPWRHRIDDALQTDGCGECHLPWSGSAPQTR
jgi:hypothetical protein